MTSYFRPGWKICHISMFLMSTTNGNYTDLWPTYNVCSHLQEDLWTFLSRVSQINLKCASKREMKNITKQASSMIHPGRPTVSSVANIVFTWNLFCFEKFGRTHGRTTCAKMMITTGHDCGLAEWINKT